MIGLEFWIIMPFVLPDAYHPWMTKIDTPDMRPMSSTMSDEVTVLLQPRFWAAIQWLTLRDGT